MSSFSEDSSQDYDPTNWGNFFDENSQDDDPTKFVSTAAGILLDPKGTKEGIIEFIQQCRAPSDSTLKGATRNQAMETKYSVTMIGENAILHNKNMDGSFVFDNIKTDCDNYLKTGRIDNIKYPVVISYLNLKYNKPYVLSLKDQTGKPIYVIPITCYEGSDDAEFIKLTGVVSYILNVCELRRTQRGNSISPIEADEFEGIIRFEKDKILEEHLVIAEEMTRKSFKLSALNNKANFDKGQHNTCKIYDEDELNRMYPECTLEIRSINFRVDANTVFKGMAQNPGKTLKDSIFGNQAIFQGVSSFLLPEKNASEFITKFTKTTTDESMGNTNVFTEEDINRQRNDKRQQEMTNTASKRTKSGGNKTKRRKTKSKRKTTKRRKTNRRKTNKNKSKRRK